MNKILLITENQIKNNSLIQINADSKTLSYTTYTAQNVYLRPVLCDVLYKQLMEAVKNKSANNTEMPEDLKELLEDYIQPYLIHLVQQDIVINLQFKITNKGTLQFNDTSASSVNSNELEYFKNYLEAKTSSYKAVLVNYVKSKFSGCCNKDADITTDSIGWYLN